MSPSREPTEHELLAMAFFDGQLEPEAAKEFEARLEREPELARAVSEFHALDLAMRTAAPPEPIDIEWARQRNDPLQRFLLHGSITLASLGFTILAVSFLIETTVGMSDVPAVFGLALIVIAAIVLIGRGVRGRLAELPFDPYIHVKR